MHPTSSPTSVSSPPRLSTLNTLGATLILAVALAIGTIYLLHRFLPDWLWQLPTLHATLEGIGITITLGLAVTIWTLIGKRQPSPAAHPIDEAAALEEAPPPTLPLEEGIIGAKHSFTDPNRDSGEQWKQKQLSLYDDLTRLPNRALFEDRLGQELKRVNRSFNSLILLLLKLDGFHDIDRSLGQGSSDMLLLEACQRIQPCIREQDTLARLEDNQFIIMLSNNQDLKTAERIAGNIIQRLGDRFTIREHELNISIHIGISVAPENGKSYRALIMHARSAMEKAKASGLNSYRFASEELHIKMLHRQDLETQLQTALKEQALRLLYQPKLDLSRSQIVGMEAFMRWPHPLRGSIPPNQFMPVAEDSDLIIQLGDWAMYWACKDAAEWIQDGHRPLRVAINLCSQQFEEENLVQKIEGILKAHGLPPQYLELELNESVIMKNYIKSSAKLRQLKALGVGTTVDNFGTTHIPLSKLKRLPVQGLKIDKGFITGLGKSSDDDTVVSAMISLANTMELEVIAEGVETEAQLEYLRKEGCSQIQGYYLGHPLAKRDFFNFVRAHELTQEAVKRLSAQSQTKRPRNPKRPT